MKGKVEYKDDSIPSIRIEWGSDENDKHVQLVQIFTIVDVELSCGRKNKNSENEIIMELCQPEGC